MKQWFPTLADRSTAAESLAPQPRYMEIAEAIGAAIRRGELCPGDRLPPQRKVAQMLEVDFSTVSRGYAEAVRRGHIESFVGRGTFVKAPAPGPAAARPERAREEDPMMNMPPEPEDPALLARMQAGLAQVSGDLAALLRYQSVTGSLQDRNRVAGWMAANGLPAEAELLAVTSGAHASLFAILSILASPGRTVLCETVTYPGLRSIAARLGITLHGVAEDAEGVLPEALEAAIRTHQPAALYLNPTLHNPTTRTMPGRRRAEIAAVLRRHGLPLVEDDAYCFTAPDRPAPLCSLLPGLGWHVAGLSKCLGAGLRLACTTVPEAAAMGQFSQALRAMHVMVSPLSLALLGRWIEDGTAADIQRSVRRAAAERQALAAEVLSGCCYLSEPGAFNLWLDLPPGTSRAEVLSRMAGCRIGLMPSDAFTVSGTPAEAIRVCLGGPVPLETLRRDLAALNDAVCRKDWLG